MTSRFVHACTAALLLAAPAGCLKKALQMPDGGVGSLPPADGGLGAGGPDVGGVTDTSGTADTAWDVAFAGRRSYVVTSQVSVDGAAVTSHTFTLTLDTRERIAFIGTNGSSDVAPLEQTATGALRVVRTLSFGVPVQAACGGSVTYDDVSFTIEPVGRLSGGGTGRLTTYPTDVANTVAATIDFDGVPDTEPPTLSLSASSDPADPWASLWIVASEPLPGDQIPPLLRSASGDVVTFEGLPTGADTSFAILAKPRQLLRFGEQYRITFGGIADFAGNPARWAGDTTFTTRAAPPLVAADGFESLTDETFGGAQVLSGAGAPTITGARSLYVPPAASLGAAGFATQLALRLPVSPGKRTLRFTYRFVNPGDESGVYLVVGTVGGTIETLSLSSNPGDTTTPVTIGQDQVRLGPTTTASIALAPDAHDDVLFARIASQAGSCAGPPPPPVPGIIIDDLRTE